MSARKFSIFFFIIVGTSQFLRTSTNLTKDICYSHQQYVSGNSVH